MRKIDTFLRSDAFFMKWPVQSLRSTTFSSTFVCSITANDFSCSLSLAAISFRSLSPSPELQQGLDFLQSRSGHPAGGYGGGYGYEDPTSLLPVRKLQESESGTSEKLFLYILIYLFI